MNGPRLVVVHGHRDLPSSRLDEPISAECRRRVARAVQLDASEIVFSGRGESLQMARVARLLGWNGCAVYENASESTRENAEVGAAIARLNRASEVVLVTSWWHAPRCWLEWRRQPGVPVLRVRPSRGSWRYVPGELVGLVRAVLR